MGICKNGTRRITWNKASDGLFDPLLLHQDLHRSDHPVSIEISVHHITSSSDFQIFDAIKRYDVPLVLDLIQNHTGTNAVDEWGQSPLIISVTNNYMTIISQLLNAFHPNVDINYQKPNGFTALMYGVQYLKDVSILEALLKRNADPNKHVLQEVRGPFNDH